MVAAIKEEVAKVAETRVAWFVVGLAASGHTLSDVFHSVTKFVGF